MHSEAGGSSAPGSPEVPEMVEPPKAEQGTAEHVNCILQANVSAEYNYLNDVRLVHDALPEVDLDAIDLSVKFFGKKLRAPLIISSMTGGFGMGKEINANLAKAAAEVGVAMGVGSQRAALEKPELAATYAVVKDHGIPLVFANLGAPQLVPQEGKRAYGIADAKRAIDMIDADALIIYLNFLQEDVQPEGDRPCGDDGRDGEADARGREGLRRRGRCGAARGHRGAQGRDVPHRVDLDSRAPGAEGHREPADRKLARGAGSVTR